MPLAPYRYLLVVVTRGCAAVSPIPLPPSPEELISLRTPLYLRRCRVRHHRRLTLIPARAQYIPFLKINCAV